MTLPDLRLDQHAYAATDAGFNADQARRHIGKADLNLATRPFLTLHNRATVVVARDVEGVLADIDTNHGNCSVLCLGHGALLVLTPLAQLIAGGAGARPDHPISGIDHSRRTALEAVKPYECGSR